MKSLYHKKETLGQDVIDEAYFTECIYIILNLEYQIHFCYNLSYNDIRYSADWLFLEIFK